MLRYSIIATDPKVAGTCVVAHDHESLSRRVGQKGSSQQLEPMCAQIAQSVVVIAMYPTHCLLPVATSGCSLRTWVGAGCSGRVLSDHAFLARRATTSRTSAKQNNSAETSYTLTAASQDVQPLGSLRVSISKDRSSQRCLAKRRGKSAVDVDNTESKLQKPISGNAWA